MKYLICNGSRDEKRGILSMIQAVILLKDRKVYMPEKEEKVKVRKSKKTKETEAVKIASKSSKASN